MHNIAYHQCNTIYITTNTNITNINLTMVWNISIHHFSTYQWLSCFITNCYIDQCLIPSLEKRSVQWLLSEVCVICFYVICVICNNCMIDIISIKHILWSHTIVRCCYILLVDIKLYKPQYSNICLFYTNTMIYGSCHIW